MTDRERLTEILQRIDLGDEDEAEALLELVYEELRMLASRHMKRERAGHTLQPTALVHEAYMRLAGGGELSVHDRHHFFRLASRAMRQVLVDSARRKGAARHGAGMERVTLDSRVSTGEPEIWDVLVLDQALERLALEDPALLHRPHGGGGGGSSRRLAAKGGQGLGGHPRLARSGARGELTGRLVRGVR
jgi:RNA polymerase sigma factor (TIGR02999 family)